MIVAFKTLLVILVVASIAGALWVLYRPVEHLEIIHSTTVNPEAPAMCPWREPHRDMAAFFPGATEYKTLTVSLSRRRLQILKRLGTGASMDSTALYVNRVLRGAEPAGVVLLRSAAGEFGAIEVVVGVSTEGRITGVRIQRHREPPQIAGIITSPEWLGVYVGKSANSPLTLGYDISAVPAPARISAQAVDGAIRSLMIEYDESRTETAVPHH